MDQKKKTTVYADGRLEVEEEQGVMVVTICRPEVHNALDLETITALKEVVLSLEQRPGVVALILAGRGKTFVSGGDLEQFSKLRGEVGGAALSTLMGDVLDHLEGLSQLTIAAMSGDTYGGGVELSMSCDLRIMDRGSWLALTQARFGLTTGWGGSVRLTRLVGYSRALDLLLNLRRLSAEEAERIGLVNQVVEDGQALDVAREMARRATNLGREVALGIKQVVHAAAFDRPEEAVLKEREIFSYLWGTENHAAQVEAFLSRKRRKNQTD